MTRNLMYAAIVVLTMLAATMFPGTSSRTFATINVSMSTAQSMLRYHTAALQLKEATPALTGTITPTISGFSSSSYTACASANALATILETPGQAMPATVVTDMQALSYQAPGIGLAVANQVNVAGTMVDLPCAAKDGSAVVYTQVY